MFTEFIEFVTFVKIGAMVAIIHQVAQMHFCTYFPQLFFGLGEVRLKTLHIMPLHIWEFRENRRREECTCPVGINEIAAKPCDILEVKNAVIKSMYYVVRHGVYHLQSCLNCSLNPIASHLRRHVRGLCNRS